MFFFPADMHTAPRVRLWNDHPDLLRVIGQQLRDTVRNREADGAPDLEGWNCCGKKYEKNGTGAAPAKVAALALIYHRLMIIMWNQTLHRGAAKTVMDPK